MPPPSKRIAPEGLPDPIISPFADTTSVIRPAAERSARLRPLWIISAAVVLVVLGNAVYFTWKYLSNPYRTLEPFSTDKYLADFQPMAGGRFRADLKVMADLGWKENVGRLMVFTEAKDTRPVLVLIPPKLAAIFFTKGQIYEVSLEVGEGGLIYADSCDKE